MGYQCHHQVIDKNEFKRNLNRSGWLTRCHLITINVNEVFSSAVILEAACLACQQECQPPTKGVFREMFTFLRSRHYCFLVMRTENKEGLYRGGGGPELKRTRKLGVQH